MDSRINDVAGRCRCSGEDVDTLDVEQVISAEMGYATRENIMFGYQRGTRNDFSEMENYRGGNGVDAVRSYFSFRST